MLQEVEYGKSQCRLFKFLFSTVDFTLLIFGHDGDGEADGRETELGLEERRRLARLDVVRVVAEQVRQNVEDDSEDDIAPATAGSGSVQGTFKNRAFVLALKLWGTR